MHPRRRRRLVGGVLLMGALLLRGIAAPAVPSYASELAELPPPAEHEGPASWAAHHSALARAGAGFVVWESNRSGSWRIWTIRLDGAGLRQLTPDEPGRDHIAPHISPDGSHVVYLSVPAPHENFRRLTEGSGALHVIRMDGEGGRLLAPTARAYWQNRSAVWLDAERLIYIDGERYTRELNLRTGDAAALSARPREKFGMLVNATRTHATTGRPSFSTYHASDKVFGERNKMKGCQPYFTHDGRYGFFVGGSGGPFHAFELEGRTRSVMLERSSRWLPDGRGYVYYPMVSRNGRLLAFGASRDEHDHFEADFDIFVAPIDPETLEVVGTAVRYTFDPGQDRFPDVFAPGEELGRRQGEAPLQVRLATPPDPAGQDGGDWRYDFGDGGAGSGTKAEHLYAQPGRYAVSAARGDVVLRGEVEVRAAAAPRPLYVEVPPGRDRLIVVFDEPISAGEAEVALASGAPVEQVEVGGDGRGLVVRLAAPLEEADTLRVAGVVDRAEPPRVMVPAELPVVVGAWPRYDAGLAWAWETAGSENLLSDPTTGVTRAAEFAPRGRARLDAHGALEVAEGSFLAEALPASLGREAAAAEAVTLELTATPLSSQEWEAHVAGLGPVGSPPLLAVLQAGPNLRARAVTRTGTVDLDFGRLGRGGSPQHLVLAWGDGRLRASRNGKEVASVVAPFDPAPWRAAPLALVVGADLAGQHDWRGTVEGVALYTRALASHEAGAHADAYLARVARRAPVPRHRVRARLTSASQMPTPKQILPYQEGLVLREYQVLSGDLAAGKVRVAHWAILDGELQPIGGGRVGEERELVLERWSDHGHLEGTYLSDTLEPDFDVPLFVDVAPSAAAPR